MIEKNCLYGYARTNQEAVIKEVGREAILEPGKDKKINKESRKSNLKNKSLRCIFFSKTELKDTRSWNWLKCGDLKSVTKGTFKAAQE